MAEDIDRPVVVRYDEVTDVLDVYFEHDADLWAVDRPSESDDLMLLAIGIDATIIGVKILYLRKSLPMEYWNIHPERAVLPKELVEAIDTFYNGIGPG
jgi:hypothetical protein